MNRRDSKKILLFLKGGLGNQLFQTLVALQFARTHKLKLEVETSAYLPIERVNHRNLEIGYFSNLEEKLDYIRAKHLDYFKKQMLSRMILPSPIVQNLGFVSDFNIEYAKPTSHSLIFDGYFQNSKLLPSDDDLRELLKFPIFESENSIEFKSKIARNGFFAIHIRRGDYLQHPQLYGILTQEYYRQGITLLRNSLGNKPLVLFSDDPNGAIKWLELEQEIDFVAPDLSREGPGEILRLMSEAKGIICSNSTYSWWAAKLGKLFGTTDRVIVPEIFVDSPLAKYQNFTL